MSAESNPLAFPALDGSVTIPESLDFHWQHNANLPMFVYSNEGSDQISKISYLEFGRACHRAAHLIRPGPSKGVVAFIALADTIVYHAITIGLMIAGFVPFPISPRNTPAAVVHLLKATSAHRILTTTVTLRTLLDGVKAELAADSPDFDLSIEEIPSLGQLYPKLGAETPHDPFERYPAPLQRVPVSDVAMILHSSGSTGFPKAIRQTHLTLSHWASFPSIALYRKPEPRHQIASMMLPSFHTLGIYLQILFPLFALNPVAVYPPIVTTVEMTPMMPTPETIIDHAVRTKCDAMMVIPALLQAWAQSPKAVEFLKSLKAIGYSGGALAPKLGNFLAAAGVNFRPSYGGTEFGSPTVPLSQPGDENEWEYMQFSDRTKVRWVPQGDGTYECQFLTTETHSLSVENLPDVRGYATSDLWEPHPTKDHLWKIVGRIDDVVIHASGEKTVPGPMEDIVMSSPYVMGTVIFGRAHDQPGILVEPRANFAINIFDQGQVSELRNKLWPVIEEANTVAPAFSRIFKEMILFTSTDKPLPRAGKGTVMRKAALKAYDEEIEALYATVEASAKGEDVLPPETWNKDDVLSWLLEQAADLHSGKEFSASDDLFEQGFDSLSATILRRRVSAALRASKDNAIINASEHITQNTVYSYPSIEALATFLVKLVADPRGYNGGSDPKEAIEAMIEKYSSGLDRPLSLQDPSTPGDKVVLLTGSTGNLGSQILADLLLDSTVRRVYALNRDSDSIPILERHIHRFVDRALDTTLLESDRLVFVIGDTASPSLGLTEQLYNEIRDSVTVIIHTAWRLDFNLSLSSFESNIRGTRKLIDMARSGPQSQSVRVLFTSSVSSAQSWGRPETSFPEEVVTDAAVAVGGGYGESKYVTERLLAKSGLQATSLRVGQVSGGLPNGAWATSDWVPILVKSSLALGALPSAAGLISWLPMDAVSKATLDIAFSSAEIPAAVNIVHPRPIPWTRVIQAFKDVFDQQGSHLRIVPFKDWLSLLEVRSKKATDADLKPIPALKLLEFFRSVSKADQAAVADGSDLESGGLGKFATVKARELSETMRDLQPITSSDVTRWVRYWRKNGFF